MGKKTPRSRKYLAWIRTLRCVGCSSHPNPSNQAAHVRIGGGGGIGLKPSDYRTVPLCFECHRWQHDHGERSFWQAIGRDPDTVILRHLARYAIHNGRAKEALVTLERLLHDNQMEPDGAFEEPEAETQPESGKAFLLQGEAQIP